MQIVIKASPDQKACLESMEWAEGLQLLWAEDSSFIKNADAYFDFCFEEEGWAFEAIKSLPVFVNAVCKTSDHLPSNAIRLNAWKSFLERPTWEIATLNDTFKQTSVAFLESIGRKAILVPDEPGFIAVRIVSMIINEAYFALGEEVSSKEAMDIALKLGTNYPYGPFEWAELIGLHKIKKLLEILQLNDDRYAPAPALLQDLANNIISPESR